VIRIVVFLAACLVFPEVAFAQQQPPKPECADVKIMTKRLIADRGLAYLSDAIDAHHEVHMWFVSPRTGFWVQLHVKENLEACVTMQGYDWHFAAGG